VFLKVVLKRITATDLWGVISCEKSFVWDRAPLGSRRRQKFVNFVQKSFIFFVQFIESQFFSAFLLQFTISFSRPGNFSSKNQ